MTRAELIRMFVLTECDGYEEIGWITKWVVEFGTKCGLTITRDEIVQALRVLMELGYLRAFKFTQQAPRQNKEYEGMPSLEEIAAFDPYFKTRDGLFIAAPLATDWLFDETNTLGKDWMALAASMKRDDFVRSFVLNSIYRHYLTIGHIEKRRDQLVKRTGIAISQDEIVQALQVLIELGSAKAYDLDLTPPPMPEYGTLPPLEDIVPYCAYFLETPEGQAVRLHGPDWWPFEEGDDEEWHLKAGWVAPSA
jgi:hypothetical protein